MSCCFQQECSLLRGALFSQSWTGPMAWLSRTSREVASGARIPPSHGSHGVGDKQKHTASPRDQLELPSSRGAAGSRPRWAAVCKQCPLPPFPPKPLRPGPRLVLSDRQPQCTDFLTFSS